MQLDHLAKRIERLRARFCGQAVAAFPAGGPRQRHPSNVQYCLAGEVALDQPMSDHRREHDGWDRLARVWRKHLAKGWRNA
jgi:hypothetical protein